LFFDYTYKILIISKQNKYKPKKIIKLYAVFNLLK
jgi:hypothetical protein